MFAFISKNAYCISHFMVYWSTSGSITIFIVPKLSMWTWSAEGCSAFRWSSMARVALGLGIDTYVSFLAIAIVFALNLDVYHCCPMTLKILYTLTHLTVYTGLTTSPCLHVFWYLFSFCFNNYCHWLFLRLLRKLTECVHASLLKKQPVLF